MKKLLVSIITILMFFIGSSEVWAAGNPYPHYEDSVFGGKIVNCTWYAWQAAKDRMGVELPLWYYVQTWYSKAQKAGFSVGQEPRANSLMVWNYGEGFGGHVSYVTKVEGDKVTYDEGGSPMTESGINTDSLTLNEMKSFLVGFIYLDVPRVTPETTKKVTTTKKPTTTTTMTTTTTSTTTVTTSTSTTTATTTTTTSNAKERIQDSKVVERKSNNSKYLCLFIALISICLIASLILILKRKK